VPGTTKGLPDKPRDDEPQQNKRDAEQTQLERELGDAANELAFDVLRRPMKPGERRALRQCALVRSEHISARFQLARLVQQL
jgi:hypothetical protein